MYLTPWVGNREVLTMNRWLGNGSRYRGGVYQFCGLPISPYVKPGDPEVRTASGDLIRTVWQTGRW